MIMGLGTLFSRILGMFRDSATAAMLGMSAGGVMDSFTLAFRFPDVARRMFGEGSLSVGFIPVFAKLWHEDREKAWSLVTAMFGGFFLMLTFLVLLGEGLCFLGMSTFSPESKVHVVSQFTSLLLPYVILICLAAVAAATLQTLGKFFVPSLIPTILNISWLTGILIFAPLYSSEPLSRCLILTGFIFLAGVIQLGLQIPLMWKMGYRFQCDWKSVRSQIRLICRTFLPSMIGLMGTQLNILMACAIAWFFSGNVENTIWWLKHFVFYPMEIGSASSIYFSERLYEFPQGLLGIAIATVIFPLLSRHAAEANFSALSEDLTFGLRIVFALAIPSGVGLMFLSDNLAHLLYQRGAFTPEDTVRTANMIFWFSFGVAGFCSIPLLARAFYALGNIRIPCLVALGSCALHVFLSMLLIWPFGEQGLAISASVSATLHAIVLLMIFREKYHYIDYRSLTATIFRSSLASAVMAVIVMIIMDCVHGMASFYDIVRISLSACFGSIVFFGVYTLLGGREILQLLKRDISKKGESTKKSSRKKRR